MILLFLFLLAAEPAALPHQIAVTGPSECRIVRDPESPANLNSLLNAAVHRFHVIRLQGGEWLLDDPIVLEDVSGIVVLSDEGDAAVLRGGRGPALVLRRVSGLRLDSMVVEGGVEMEQTDGVTFRGMTFLRRGIWLKGKRCNQPNECVDYHRNLVVEDSTFRECEQGILAERLEGATIHNNRFSGEGPPSSCARAVGVEIDGKMEDLDRRLEYGNVKASRITANVFEQPFAVGIRLRYTQANMIRDNRFSQSFRALEVLEGARFNQIQDNHISYLSQMPASSACPVPCGIYAGPGAFNNVFLNNFFEQDFELQFLDRHRNRLSVIDESGGTNIFRSDFLPIRR